MGIILDYLQKCMQLYADALKNSLTTVHSLYIVICCYNVYTDIGNMGGGGVIGK